MARVGPKCDCASSWQPRSGISTTRGNRGLCILNFRTSEPVPSSVHTLSLVDNDQPPRRRLFQICLIRRQGVDGRGIESFEQGFLDLLLLGFIDPALVDVEARHRSFEPRYRLSVKRRQRATSVALAHCGSRCIQGASVRAAAHRFGAALALVGADFF